MSKDDKILKVIKELAKGKGSKLSLTSIYRGVIQKGIYTSENYIRNALKRLEIRGKIKTGEMDQIELLPEGDGN